MAEEKMNAYRAKRKDLGLSIEAAAEKLGMSDDTLGRIETEQRLPNPQEVMLMSKAYKAPELCNHYCHFDCEIGQKYVPEIEQSELPNIILKLLASLYDSDELEKLIVKIAEDNEIGNDEVDDLVKIQLKLEQLSMAIEALQLCVEKKMDNDEISREVYEKAYRVMAKMSRKD